MTTQEKRRDAMTQALANTRIAGHEPTPRFLADVAAVVEGKMTYEQAIRTSAARARSRNGSEPSGLPKT
ncbi:antitoxin VbhA family protein [Variovorax sp. ZT5P49]|uniref:antitoxin VbhA family protein n=1 Tax=Variovorax sp. ZT5P49 TaxID=3443733 RepID=UPI003F450CDA